MPTIKISILPALMLSLCGVTAAAQSQPESRVRLDIEPQPLRAALRDLGAQAGLHIVFRAEDVARNGITSPRIVGELSAQQALERMLAESGLKYEFVNERTVRISPLDTPVATSQGERAGTDVVRLSQSAGASG